MSAAWWRDAVVYQVYIRSFADGDGDGVGDIAGLRSRLRYVADLGADAIWINPWYPSPMKDGGYDVADFRAIDPSYGTLADAEAMISDAHELGLRVLLDIVPNHLSDQHAWFQDALAAGPGSVKRDRFIFHTGRGAEGERPPNDWRSTFGGSAWTRVNEPGGRRDQWYLHLFAPEQPDLNWTNPDVRAEFADILRFWFGRGVDGFRVDVAHGLAKAEGLPDVGEVTWPMTTEMGEHPHWDRDEVHDIYRSWRTLADSYDEPRVFVAEAWVVGAPERLARYVRADELHTAFNFDFLLTPWDAAQLRRSIDTTLAAHRVVGAPPIWVLSNHDVAREVSRYARPQDVRRFRHLSDLLDLPADFALGRARARAAALLMLALPGSAFLYQGEELGLAEVEDLPEEALHDPTWEQSGHTDRGRDGSRVPIPWSSDRPPFGFSPAGMSAPPWLPQPASWSGLSVAAQTGDATSMLELYRRALRIRREHRALGDGDLTWLQSPAGVLMFAREPGFVCVANVSGQPLAPPAGVKLLLSSAPLADGGRIPTNVCAWFER